MVQLPLPPSGLGANVERGPFTSASEFERKWWPSLLRRCAQGGQLVNISFPCPNEYAVILNSQTSANLHTLGKCAKILQFNISPSGKERARGRETEEEEQAPPPC